MEATPTPSSVFVTVPEVCDNPCQRFLLVALLKGYHIVATQWFGGLPAHTTIYVED